jgi:glycopeptide antibiotics resistance protein
MGKRGVRVVVVRKGITLALLFVVSVLMAWLVWFLSGKAYVNDAHPVRELVARMFGKGRQALSRDAALAFMMPVIANVLLFVPWGFLTFLAFDRETRPRLRTYLLTCIFGLAFAAALQIWQLFLPTRVTAAADALANVLGTLGGAALGHMRKRVHVRFEY